jgi:hypothetical protein
MARVSWAQLSKGKKKTNRMPIASAFNRAGGVVLALAACACDLYQLLLMSERLKGENYKNMVSRAK